MRKEREIVMSLQFPENPIRHEMITEAYARTFAWIYNTKFAEWLSGKLDSTQFWITDKPGCRKSTLMKFVADHPETKRLVAEWAGLNRVIVVRHYFWSAGTDLQRSLQGLLQSLVLDILRQYPFMIPTATPARWGLPQNTILHSWIAKELLGILQHAGCYREALVKFCLFMDGLGEFDEDHGDLCGLARGRLPVPKLQNLYLKSPVGLFSGILWLSSTCYIIHPRAHEERRSNICARPLGKPRQMENISSLFRSKAGGGYCGTSRGCVSLGLTRDHIT